MHPNDLHIEASSRIYASLNVMLALYQLDTWEQTKKYH